MNRIALVYTTISDLATAEALGKEAIAEKIAACVNIIPTATSIYEWEGVIETASESLMLFKTDVSRIIELMQWIKERHPYTVPAILAVEPETTADFFAYVQRQVIMKG